MGFHRACFECELGKYKIRVTRTLFTKMDSECLLEKFVPVLLMKTKEVKRLKMTDKKVKRCGTTAARKLHSCDLCHYKAPFISVLRRHRLTHTAEKCFQCPICPYKTTTKHNLAQHHLAHTGVKPFECSLCPYKASQKSLNQL